MSQQTLRLPHSSRSLSLTNTVPSVSGLRLPSSPISISISICFRGIRIRGSIPALTASLQKGSLHQQLGDSDSPLSVELLPICSDAQFHRVVAHTHQNQDAVIIVWMADWCRKCVYLKPKLEKLAAEYYPRLQFYGVDVNTVSHKLVAHAGVTKMPTIQLWKDGKKQAEVVGGLKAYWVIGDVQEMIENECTM